jgi:DNA-binding response OmpR family regulator
MKPLRVLVVEDEILIAMLITQVLEDMGHDVCATESTKAGAVAAAAQHKPDFMIVDAGLPDGSGVSAVEEILLAAQVAHIFVSGDVAGIKALRPHAVVVQKPFFASDLNRAMQLALRQGATP